MAEQTFRSPGFFEQEIELIAGAAGPSGTPVGIAGTAKMGPAFVPVTVGNFADFQSAFGGLDIEKPATYAASEWLKNREALTFVRTLGAGSAPIAIDGTVKNAGFVISGSGFQRKGGTVSTSSEGAVTFIAALHDINVLSDYSLPMFADNPSFKNESVTANLIRGMIFTASGTKVEVLDHDKQYNDTVNQTSASLGLSNEMLNKFKLVLSSTDGSYGTNGIRILTASLNPLDSNYIENILNTDPDLFEEKKHLLYAHFPVDHAVSKVSSAASGSIAVLTGTIDSSDDWLNGFGRFDTRYQGARTTSFISQPYGKFEYDLFHFECVSDGDIASSMFKVSIQNIIASTDKSNPYGTFDVVVRKFNDDDISPQILEYYPKLSLNPAAENYIAKKIGDKKVYYNFDAADDSEKRLIIKGKFANRSRLIRVVVNSQVESGAVPASALPFGFRGLPVLKTNGSLNDYGSSLSFDGQLFSGKSRLTTHHIQADFSLTGSILPPLPFRYKVTRGAVQSNSEPNIGMPGVNERADSRLYWGVMLHSVPSDNVLDANNSVTENKVVRNLSKFLGIAQKNTLVTGSEADVFNANKFTLARVAFAETKTSYLTGSADLIMKGASYVRNGTPDTSNYYVTYKSDSRVTLASLINSSSVVFNRFTQWAKFTNVFYGGFDGLNILNRDNRKMSDKAASTEADGLAQGVDKGGLTKNVSGIGKDNNVVASYRIAANILTDEFSSRANMIAIPGIRESLVQDYLSEKVRENSLMVHIRDIASYDDNGERLWDDSTKKANVRQTSEAFANLNIDNNYTAVYYPDVFIDDETNLRRVKIPASIAALGAIGYNDKVSYPWFAPAGFNRGALDFVKNVTVRLNSSDRDTLYDARINPIATFPSGGYVIFGQKTLQLAKSSLDRLNVRRLIVEVKRAVVGEANRILFEQNTQATRNKFINAVSPKLATIKARAGIESFSIIMDSSNNTQADIDANRVNGRIVVVPTRTIEFIAIDFVVTNSGVSFQ